MKFIIIIHLLKNILIKIKILPSLHQKIFTIPSPSELDLTDYYRSNDKNFEKVINKLDE